MSRSTHAFFIKNTAPKIAIKMKPKLSILRTDPFNDPFKRCHAWFYVDEKGEVQYTTILEIPPVDSAETAVKIAIAARARTI